MQALDQNLPPKDGNGLPNGSAYSPFMDKTPKNDSPYHPVPTADPVEIVRYNVKKCFEYAKLTPRLSDRTTPIDLVRYSQIKANRAQIGGVISKTMLYRLVNGDGKGGITVRNMARIARAFDLESWHLLIADLDLENLPLGNVSPAERTMIMTVRGAIQDSQQAARRAVSGNVTGENSSRSNSGNRNSARPTGSANALPPESGDGSGGAKPADSGARKKTSKS